MRNDIDHSRERVVSNIKAFAEASAPLKGQNLRDVMIRAVNLDLTSRDKLAKLLGCDPQHVNKGLSGIKDRKQVKLFAANILASIEANSSPA